MARAQVLDKQRKRIRQACKGCRSRKKKCDGQDPCSGCKNRGLSCSYDPLRTRKSVTPRGFIHHSPYDSPSILWEWSNSFDVQLDRCEPVAAPRVPKQASVPVCDSSSASFLAEIKRLVLQKSGLCPFTESHDHLSRMRSNSRSQQLPAKVHLPARNIADNLVKRARQYSNHLVEILDESTIQELLHSSYSNVSSQDPSSRCLLYLLFAAGSLAVERKEITNHPLLSPLESFQQADEYFEFAEATLRIGGYETFEVWMIRAWALMTTYSLAVSKWNAADVYIGLAVRAADVLGINRALRPSSRTSSEVKTKFALYGKLWKCLFVLDSLVAALLGRKPQVLKEEKSKTAAAAAGTGCSPLSHNGRDDCLEFNVASANMIRRTIKLVYNQRHFPAERASPMLEQAQLYAPVSFQGQDAADTLATQLAILFRNYASMLLTRPFFVQELYQPSKQEHDRTWTSLSTTCVITAHQSIQRIHKVLSNSPEFRNDYMWRPCLYTAILAILTNQFFDFYKYQGSNNVVEQAFAILELCNAQNPKEEGELSSLSSLRRFVDDQMARRLPTMGGGCGRPVYVDMSPCGGEAVGYDVPGDGRTGAGVFQEFTAEFAAEFAAIDYTKLALVGAL